MTHPNRNLVIVRDANVGFEFGAGPISEHRSSDPFRKRIGEGCVVGMGVGGYHSDDGPASDGPNDREEMGIDDRSGVDDGNFIAVSDEIGIRAWSGIDAGIRCEHAFNGHGIPMSVSIADPKRTVRSDAGSSAGSVSPAASSSESGSPGIKIVIVPPTIASLD
jgi:hypothetical protein